MCFVAAHCTELNVYKTAVLLCSVLCHAVLQVSPLLRILITRSVALVPALTVALLTRNSSESTGLDTLNQWLNLVRRSEGG